MIENYQQIEERKEALDKVEKAYYALKKKIYPNNPELFEAMSQDYLKMIKEIRTEIDEFLEIDFENDPNIPLWVRVMGKNINVWSTPTTVWSSILTNLRRSVSHVAKLFVPEDYDFNFEATDFQVVGLKSGSLKIGLTLPSFSNNNNLRLKDIEIASQGLNKFLEALTWVSSNNPVLTNLDSVFDDDEEKRNKVMKEIYSLVPKTDRKIELIEFTGPIVPSVGPIQLTERNAEKIKKVIEKGPEEIKGEFIGIIREIDLDKYRCILRNRENSKEGLHCIINKQVLDQVKNLLDRKVKMGGVFRKGKKDFYLRSIIPYN